MKIAIVDDDKQIHNLLTSLLDDQLGSGAEIQSFLSGEAFLAAWRPGAFDLILLDIFMSGRTGVDIAREIRKTDPEVKIVFSTSSNEFASESYEVNACYYLRKPFGVGRVKAMLDRLNLAEIEEKRALRLPDGSYVVLRQVLYVDFAAHRVVFHCKNQQNLAVRANFTEMEEQLCAYPYFFSPTKGVVVNFYEVKNLSGDVFCLSDVSLIPISRRKAKEVMEAYSSFRFDRLRKGGM